MDSQVFRQIMPAEFHRRFLVKNRRADGRAFHSYRQPAVATKVLSNCIGSASVRCGNSYYIAGVRCEVGRPVEMQGVQLPCADSQSPSLPTEPGGRASQPDNACSSAPGPVPNRVASTSFPVGQVSVSVEFPKLCGAEFRDSAGPCTQIPLLVSGVVADLLNSPAVIDKRQFVFSRSAAASATTRAGRPGNLKEAESNSRSQNAPETAAPPVAETDPASSSGTGGTDIDSACSGKSHRQRCAAPQYAWHLFVHVMCLEYDGNPLDCAVLAAVAALEDACLPGIVWDDNAKWWRQLPRSAERRNQRPVDMVASDTSDISVKSEDSTAAETRRCFIPARKIQLLERPVAVTFSHLLSAYWVVDPTKEEEALGCSLTICFIKDRWEITRFGGPPVKIEIIGSLKTVAGVIAKGIKRLVKMSNESA